MGFIGLLILAGTEIITIKEDIGRMNTVFKFYLQSWILINISSSFFLGIILVLKPEKSYQKIFKSVFSITLIFLTASCFLYTIFGTHSRIQDRFTSTPLNLDGALFMEKANYKDYEKLCDEFLQWPRLYSPHMTTPCWSIEHMAWTMDHW